MDTGSSFLNTRRNVNISSMAMPSEQLYVPHYRVFMHSLGLTIQENGKVRPFDIMMKNEELLHTFTRLGQSDIVSSEVSVTLECYVCSLYGKPNSSDVNAARYKILYKMHAPHTGDKPLEKIKSADPCCLSPCKTSLQQKIKRTS